MFASRLRRAALPPTRLPLPPTRRPHRGRGASFPKSGIASARSARRVIVCGASKTIQAEGGPWPLAPKDRRGRGRFLSARTNGDDDFELPPLDLTSLSSLSIPLPPNMPKEGRADATEGGDATAGGETSGKIDGVGIEPNAADGQRRGGGSFLSRGIAMMKKRPTNGGFKTRDAPKRGKTSVLDKVNPSRASGADWKEQAQSIARKGPPALRAASSPKVADSTREGLLEELKNDIKEAEEAMDRWAWRLSSKREDLRLLREEMMQEQRRGAIKPKPRKFHEESLRSGSSLPYSAAKSNALKHVADGNHSKEALLACKKEIQSWLEDEFPRPGTGSPPEITFGERFGNLTKLNDRIKELEEGILDENISSTQRERIVKRLFLKMRGLHVLKEYGLTPRQFRNIRRGIEPSINISWCERRWEVLQRRQREFYSESSLSPGPRNGEENAGSNADDCGKYATDVGDKANADEIGLERLKTVTGIGPNRGLRTNLGASNGAAGATEETAVADDLASFSRYVQANEGEDGSEREKLMMDDSIVGNDEELEGGDQWTFTSLDALDEEGSDDDAEDHEIFANDETDEEESIDVLSSESSNTAASFYQTRWMERYSQLKQYKSLNGDTDVPRRSSDYPELGPWVSRQRMQYKKGSLADDRVQLLNDIGFVWSPGDHIWEQRFNDLKQYKSLNGHTNVPKRSSDYPELGPWVSRQRIQYKKGNLADGRVERLNDVGFAWSLA